VPMRDAMSVRRVSVWVLAAATLALAGCNEGSGGNRQETVDPRAALLGAMAEAYEVGTMHQEFSFEMSAGGQSFAFTGDGDVDNERRRMDLSMDMGMLGGSMDMRLVDGVVYMRSPMFAGAGGANTEWVSMDPSKMDPQMAAQFGGGFGTTDPSAYVGLFAGTVDVREAGSEAIGGVRTTRYEGTIDIEEVLRRFPEVLGDDVDAKTRRQLVRGMEQALEQFDSIGVDGRLPFEVWIDDEGLLRRQVISMDFGGVIPGAEDASMRMQVDFSAFGEPVDIEPPPAKDVTDLTDLMGHAQGLEAA
jgi:hypothetical protein